MGSCFDRKTQDPTEKVTFLGDKPAPKVLKTGGKSGLLYKNITKEVINEEDSQIRGSSLSALSFIDMHDNSAIVMF